MEPIELKIVLFDCSMKERNPSKVVALDHSKPVHVRLASLPQGSSDARKFLVLKNAKRMYLVVGPKFVDDRQSSDFYFHKELRQIALHILDRDGSKKYQISGGGTVGFYYWEHQKDWAAEFSGSSSDYGTYDPGVLLHMQAIAEWLNMPAIFEWRDRRDPAKK